MSQIEQDIRRGGSVSVPVLGEAIPQRNAPILRSIGTGFMRLLGWQFVGTVPNITKLVAIGAPHTSTWDVILAVAAFWALDVRLTLMAKDSLFFWPLGPFMRWLGAVPIDRSRAAGLVEQMVEQLEASDRMIVALAPEGTRSKVEKWKTGFYHIAYGASVPIICVGIDFGRKQIIFREPFIPTGNLDEDLAIMQEWFSHMTAKHPECA